MTKPIINIDEKEYDWPKRTPDTFAALGLPTPNPPSPKATSKKGMTTKADTGSTARLTSEEMQEILVELMTGKPPRLQTPAAQKFREQSRKEIDAIVADGGSVDIPSEFPE
jgi:hypothetical protein